MAKILAALACNLDKDILEASLPLFVSEKVEAIEWSFDTLYRVRNIPDWFVQLLLEYGAAGRLIGHGVFFSLFSGRWSAEQEDWLMALKKKCESFQFDHISEHFGFLTGADFHHGAPVSIPFNASTLAIGIDRLKRIQDACQSPTGLENLAFSYSLEEVKRHGDFLDRLLEPINGFIIFDLHNLYCQLCNFDLDTDALISLYPLDRVREIHISGGSWEPSMVEPGQSVRRDTHDDSVPEEVFQLLQKVIPLCPNLKYVVLEQLGNGLATLEQKTQFQADFLKMNQLVQNANAQLSAKPVNDFLPESNLIPHPPVEDLSLYEQQSVLSKILEEAENYAQARAQLKSSCLAGTDWDTEEWKPAMLETALLIAQKWKGGF